MIGLGLGLTLSAARAQIFDLAHLFTSGSGFCYPLSPGTLWQDAAGTLPVTADGQVVGFAQDASKGLALGPELVTNGGFDTDLSGWSVVNPGGTATVAAVGGVATISGPLSGNTGLTQDITATAGAFVRLAFKSAGAANWPRVLIADAWGFSPAIYTQMTAGEHRAIVGPLTTGKMRIYAYAASVATEPVNFDNISVREVLGNHATQTGTASIRPTYKTNPTRLSFDGSDDRLVSTLKPTASGTIACRFQTSTAGSVMIGSQGATDGRCYLGIGSDGRLAAGIGATGMTTITGGTDIRGTGWRSGAVTWDGSTVKLYLDGAEVYSGAQSGAVNTTFPMAIGALNANGTQNSFFLGDILANPIALDYAATPAQIAQMHQAWSNQT